MPQLIDGETWQKLIKSGASVIQLIQIINPQNVDLNSQNVGYLDQSTYHIEIIKSYSPELASILAQLTDITELKSELNKLLESLSEAYTCPPEKKKFSFNKLAQRVKDFSETVKAAAYLTPMALKLIQKAIEIICGLITGNGIQLSDIPS
ncbi:hypothetical protein [Moorella sp. E306M]|uniref:hypothetical protein n=1 Tax=Moorella sp. E306M TaxID=2572683 RepID=UPI001143A4AB|nr:hypothetical protein [Moorella sp. E306M]